jgi:hypothetical protein
MAIAKWVGSMDESRVQAVLNGAIDPEDLDAIYETEGDDVCLESEASYAAPLKNHGISQRSAA